MRLALFGQNLIKFQDRNMEHLNESIQSNLALEIAQLTLDKATLKAQVDYLTKQNAELQQQLDEATAPQN